MKFASESGTFIPSETAMISASVLDLEFSSWTLDLDMKLPTPEVTHMPDVDVMSSRLANTASVDTVTLGGMSHPSRSVTSLVALRQQMSRSSFLFSVVGALTRLHSLLITSVMVGFLRLARYSAVATSVWKILVS
jgi:hypothetical protein